MLVCSDGGANTCVHTRGTLSKNIRRLRGTFGLTFISTQLAFIMNQQQHWYTLRRFGPALPSHEEDPGDGHWFNLNSSIPEPEWVGKLYLHMFLEQAEADGKDC